MISEAKIRYTILRCTVPGRDSVPGMSALESQQHDQHYFSGSSKRPSPTLRTRGLVAQPSKSILESRIRVQALARSLAVRVGEFQTHARSDSMIVDIRLFAQALLLCSPTLLQCIRLPKGDPGEIPGDYGKHPLLGTWHESCRTWTQRLLPCGGFYIFWAHQQLDRIDDKTLFRSVKNQGGSPLKILDLLGGVVPIGSERGETWR
jgi:hypothetical protein